MPKLKRLHHGVGAKISVYTKFLHPRKLVMERYPNASKTDVLHGLLAVAQEDKTVSKKQQACIIMRHDDFGDGHLLHAVTRYCKVVEEGVPEHFFNDLHEEGIEGGGGAVAVEGAVNQCLEIPSHMGDDDIQNYRAMGFGVDDDNDPAPENIPTATASNAECEYYEWNSDTWDQRKLIGVNDFLPTLVGADPTLHTILGYFSHFLPISFFKDTVIPATNNGMADPLTWEEFLCFLGLIFLMATTQGNARQDFWATETPNYFSGAPYRLNSYMSRRRFETILKHLTFTSEDPPPFRHPFHPVNELINAFNVHTRACFNPSWVSCLDESISVWTNQWTCPGWMFVPRKPHPMGNEYHTLCCGLSGIMYSIELVEGKDRPKELPPPKYHEKGKTSALLLRLTESIAHSGRVVIMDSGFCVLRSIVDLARNGVFSSAVIKKRRYWPKYIDGEHIDKHFEGKSVGTVEYLPGKLDGLYSFKICCMKEEPYVMKLMSTYGSAIEADDKWTQRTVTENGRSILKRFKYHEPFANHFKYRHQVDDHNNLRHSPISLETSLSTKDWKIRVFSFILAVVEVNARLAHKYFSGSDEPMHQIEFRRKLAQELIECSYRVRVRGRSRRQSTEPRYASSCGEETAPKYAGKWTGTEWTKLRTLYPQHICRTHGCNKRIRTYCRCNIGHFLCSVCIGVHIASKGNDNVLES